MGIVVTVADFTLALNGGARDLTFEFGRAVPYNITNLSASLSFKAKTNGNRGTVQIGTGDNRAVITVTKDNTVWETELEPPTINDTSASWRFAWTPSSPTGNINPTFAEVTYTVSYAERETVVEPDRPDVPDLSDSATQSGGIHVYSPNDTFWSYNGLCTLYPTKCTVEEEAGGAYELTLEHPLTQDSRLQYLKPDYLIKSPIPAKTLAPLSAYSEISQYGEGCEMWRTGSTKQIWSQPEAGYPASYSEWQFGVKYGPGSKVMFRGQAYKATVQNWKLYPTTNYYEDWNGEVHGGKAWVTIGNWIGGTIVGVIPGNTEYIMLESVNSIWQRVVTTDGTITGYMQFAGNTSEGPISAETIEQLATEQRTLTSQMFRIYKISMDRASNRITVNARHISYDFERAMIGKCLTFDYTPARTLTAIQAALLGDDERTIRTNITGMHAPKIKQDYSFQNPLKAILDPDNGVVALTKAQLVRDNRDIYLMRNKTPIPTVSHYFLDYPAQTFATRPILHSDDDYITLDIFTLAGAKGAVRGNFTAILRNGEVLDSATAQSIAGDILDAIETLVDGGDYIPLYTDPGFWLTRNYTTGNGTEFNARDLIVQLADGDRYSDEDMSEAATEVSTAHQTAIELLTPEELAALVIEWDGTTTTATAFAETGYIYGDDASQDVPEERIYPDYRITYGVNMRGVQWDEDIDEVVTRILPVGETAAGEPLLLPELFVDSEYRKNFAVDRIEYLQIKDAKIGSKYTPEGETQEQERTKADCIKLMRKEARKRFSEDYADREKLTLAVDFVHLGDTEEYAQYRGLQRLGLYDIVQITDTPLGMSATAQVIGITYDAILHRLTAIKLGDPFQYEGRGTVAGYQLSANAITFAKLSYSALKQIKEAVTQ